jgi:hypothetical protein
MSGMGRREAVGLLAAPLAYAQHQMQQMRKSGAKYVPQFFDAAEFQKLDALAEAILPADEHSPGASQARVADFLDLLVSASGVDVRQQWRSGLAVLSIEGLPAAASEERTPKSDAGRFFVMLKQAVVFAYYSSEIGIRKELGYLGNQAIARFPGCEG